MLIVPLSGPYFDPAVRSASVLRLQPAVGQRPLGRNVHRPAADVGTTAAADLSPPAAPSQRSRAASAVLGYLADLVDNVQSGMEQNRRATDPARANRRLLDTASELADSMVTEARVEGQPLFGRPGQGPQAAYEKQSRTAVEAQTVDQARGLLTEASRLFRSLQPSTAEEEKRANYVLGKFRDRVRDASTSGTGPVDSTL
ncbi:MAG: hypothetical protein JST30_13410 [Armatimonadetes bacterium]|nr:hypothetical protein [Armatimonadota bacterium]